jgi:hypothetical protein
LAFFFSSRLPLSFFPTSPMGFSFCGIMVGVAVQISQPPLVCQV